MNITFNGKEELFDDMEYCWTVESAVNKYNVTILFVGGVNNETREEDLSCSVFADIDITEVDHHDRDILDEVRTALSDMETDIYTDTIMVSAPDIRDTLTVRNESDYDGTIEDFHKMMSVLTTVLLRRETESNIAA